MRAAEGSCSGRPRAATESDLGSDLLHQFTRHNAYPFQVNLWANKEQIKAAVQELFNVRVKKVRTQNRLGKQRHVWRTPFRVKSRERWRQKAVDPSDEWNARHGGEPRSNAAKTTEDEQEGGEWDQRARPRSMSE